MHNAFLNIDNRKMSKSAGNFFTVRDIAEKYDLQVLRFFMLSAHYRSPLNFSAELMAAAKNGLERIVTGAGRLAELEAAKAGEKPEAAANAKAEDAKTAETALSQMTAAEQESWAAAQALTAKYEAAMDDDFNTADAIAAVFELVKLANTTAGADSTLAYVTALKEELCRLCDILGLITEKKAELLDAEIEQMIAKRQQARKERDFALADRIRAELSDRGILLEDTREGVKWKRA